MRKQILSSGASLPLTYKLFKKSIVALLILATILPFTGCQKLQDARVTFYVSNAGSAGKWDYISVSLNGQSGSFFTPERRNMSLSSCNEAEYSTTFYVPAGTYSYSANNGMWSGTITVDGGDCQLVILQY